MLHKQPTFTQLKQGIFQFYTKLSVDKLLKKMRPALNPERIHLHFHQLKL